MASNSDTVRIVITAIGITAMNLPMIPATNISGANATRVVVTEWMTGAATSENPSTTASAGFLPRPKWVKMFSPKTVASSTRMPRVMI